MIFDGLQLNYSSARLPNNSNTVFEIFEILALGIEVTQSTANPSSSVQKTRNPRMVSNTSYARFHLIIEVIEREFCR